MKLRSSRWTIACFLIGGWVLVNACGNTSSTTNNGHNTTTDVKSFFPKDSEITGWVEDKSRLHFDGVTPSTAGAPDVANDLVTAKAYIDGSADKFEGAGGWVKMVTEYYKKNDFKITLSIHEMTTADSITPVWAKFVTEGTAVTLNAGEQGAVKRFYLKLWVELDARKGKYFFMVLIESATGALPDTAATELETFTAAVMKKIP